MSKQASKKRCGCPHDLTQEEIIEKLEKAIGYLLDKDWAAQQKHVYGPDISAVRKGRRKPVGALCEAIGIVRMVVYREKKR